ncbi:Gp19/Gp15/Gp42 family protein [Nocardia sp. CA-128927]|uniref:Gp19/Gp15/Gp42 family protein n=1 Tax=Nocardia sp. CA-128927 TaxID=3239975 RepID=UPI003D9753E1
MAWATAHDVRDRWVGPDPFPAEVTDQQLGTLIGDVEDSVVSEFPDIQRRIDDYDTPPTPPNLRAIPKKRVVKVVCRVVLRHLRNPEGTRSKTQGTGPFSMANTYGGEDLGALYLTDEDRDELAGLGPLGGGQKAFTVDTIPTPS